MQIEFKKVGNEPKHFEISNGGLSFDGYMQKDKDLVLICAKLFGSIDLVCDICGQECEVQIDENIVLKASNGIFSGDCAEIDVIEFFDQKIDMDYILEGEIITIKSDYFTCKNCEINTKEE